MTPAPRGDLELSILLAIRRLDEDAYGLRIRDDVQQLRQRASALGAIYTTLQRLEEKGLVVSHATAPLPQRGGRSRRVYRLTAAGQSALADARRLASRLWQLGTVKGTP
jgi:PadR family transcriptional regulator, regulatory protein PadR